MSLLNAGRAEQAGELLLNGSEQFENSIAIQVLLGIAYAKQEEYLWAIDTLEHIPPGTSLHCEKSAWLAWAYFQLALLEEASAVLNEAVCRENPPAATQILMLRALFAHYEGDEQTARDQMDLAFGQDQAYETDRGALGALAGIVMPERLQALRWSLDSGGGYTSNARLGSPQDPTTGSTVVDSGLLQWNGWVNFTPELGTILRPMIEAQVRTLWFIADSAEDLSHLTLSGRVGLMFDWGIPRLIVGYRPEYLLTGQMEGEGSHPVWYFAGHRAELEAEVTPWLMTFWGGGYRSFEELGRNRTEVDGGLGGRVPLWRALDLLWAVTGRWYRSQNSAYDLLGIGGMANLRYRFGRGWWTGVGLNLSGDWYPSSAGFFAEPERRDLFYKTGAQIWTPELAGVRLSISYQFSRRESAVEQYSASDHQALLRLSWLGGLDFDRPSIAPEQPLVQFDWGIVRGETGPNQRIQDLLRQDEQLYRSCGCVE